MSNVHDRTHTLTGRYLDGGISAEELKELEALLRDYEDARVTFLNQTNLTCELALVMKPSETAGRQRRSRRTPFRWGAWLSIAACLAIINGALVYNQWRSTQFVEVLVAHIKVTAPDVRIIHRGETIIAVVDMKIYTGDRIETGPGQKAGLTYEAEKTEILIDENTMLDIGSAREGKRLHLERGVLDATVAPQLANKPMIVTTAHARADVLGAVFKLAVEAGSVVEPLTQPLPKGERRGNTRIDVFEGLVHLTRLSDGESVDVGSGFSAVAGEGIELIARPVSKQVAASVAPGDASWAGYVDGPVLFEDDFEKDLANWLFSTFEERDGGLGPVPTTIDQLGGQVTREKRSVRGADSTILVFRLEKGGPPVVAKVTERMTATETERMAGTAFSIEFDELIEPGTTVDHIIFLSDAPVKRFYAHPDYPDVPAGKWLRRRVEIIVMRTESGKRNYDCKEYVDGILWSHHRILTGEFVTGFVVSRGELIVDNYVVRAMLPEEK